MVLFPQKLKGTKKGTKAMDSELEEKAQAIHIQAAKK